ncbi:nucleotidyltransferase family protein [Actinomadura sp. 6N118]|uniref:nucleotidyltransferase family protein n=1 Tax=Actinomadura sp. 6N118 TaxID=3375151 RepID=UPI0037A0A251
MTGQRTVDLPRRLRSFVADEFGANATAAFVYGSVAAQRARRDSDIDFFVITRAPIRLERLTQIASAFATLQRDLGYVPDPKYPIEIFTAEECRKALAAPAVKLELRRIADREGPPTVLGDSDEVEILRALLDHRIEILADPLLISLTEQASLLHAQTQPPDKE